MQRAKNGSGIYRRVTCQARSQATGQLPERICLQGALGLRHNGVPNEIECSLLKHENEQYETEECILSEAWRQVEATPAMFPDLSARVPAHTVRELSDFACGGAFQLLR